MNFFDHTTRFHTSRRDKNPGRLPRPVPGIGAPPKIRKNAGDWPEQPYAPILANGTKDW